MRKTVQEYRQTYYRKHKQQIQVRNKSWLDKNKDKMLNYWRARKLGITLTLEQERELRTRQLNKCAICFKPALAKGRTLSLDHDHITKRIRGFLCVNCNNGLGRFKDSEDLLHNAILYLRRHNDSSTNVDNLAIT